MKATQTSLLGGRLRLWQPAVGYRITVDSLLLAKFAATRQRSRYALDLGAGVGAVGLAVAELCHVERLDLLERDEGLAELARQNLATQAQMGRALRRDLHDPQALDDLAGQVDLVVCNPPYHEPGRHRPSPELSRRTARSGLLATFVLGACRVLGPKGRLCVIYPTAGLPSVLELGRQSALVVKRMQFVHATACAPSRVVLIELRRAKSAGLAVAPPIIEWLAPGVRSQQIAGLLGSDLEISVRHAGDRT